MYKFVLSLCLMVASLSTHADETIGYRGEILYFTDNPVHHTNAYKHYPDGVLYISKGKVVTAGDFNSLQSQYQHAKIIDYSGDLIVPGFIDTHVHYPQTEMIAGFGEQLLDWLDQYTFPEELKFSDRTHASRVADLFLDQLITHGTTTALVFATVSPVSVDAFFEEASKRNMRMISGKVLMDRNAPAGLLDTPESAYTDSKNLIEKWKNHGRLKYAITPRFAPTSSPEELAVARRLLSEYPDTYLHTHVAENKSEVAWVQALFPQSRSYLDVYDQYGLVTSRSIFAHGIYLTDQDMGVLAAKGGSIAFCPSSNLFLGSGLFNLARANQFNVKVGLGTDVGAGTTLSLLQTMNEAYKVTQMRKSVTDNPNELKSLDPFESLYLATLGGARALSLDNQIGSFSDGKEADFIVLKHDATPLLKARILNAKSLRDKLFAYEILGDDRAIRHTYVMGVPLK